MTVEELDAVEARIVAARGPLDEVWYRGAPGTPYFHNAPRHHAASVEVEMGQKLRELVATHQPKVLVEVGTNRGFSTTWLMLGMLRYGGARLTTFDIADVRAVHGTPYWEQFGLPPDVVDYVTSAVWDAGDRLPAEIDFVFHDASHDEEPTRREVEVLAPRVRVGGVMAFHDIFLCRHQGEVLLKWFAKHPEWKYEEWQYGRGLGIARKEAASA